MDISIITIERHYFMITKYKVMPLSEIETPPDLYPDNKRTVVISDIEGDFTYFINSLKGNSVINNNFEWIYSDGSLVILGDVFDRGDLVTECLWLIYKLEQEASRAGGQVHFILGNHEIMALNGDDRYVHKKYKRLLKSLNRDYSDLFSKDTELGRWIRSKNVIEMIGSTVYAHGGLSPALANTGLSIAQINQIVRSALTDNAAGKNLSDAHSGLIMNTAGPLWYRGYFDGSATQSEVDSTLGAFDAERIVVGHTIVPQIKAFYNNKVIAIDVEKDKKGGPVALLIEKDIIYMINQQGNKTLL